MASLAYLSLLHTLGFSNDPSSYTCILLACFTSFILIFSLSSSKFLLTVTPSSFSKSIILPNFIIIMSLHFCSNSPIFCSYNFWSLISCTCDCRASLTVGDKEKQREKMHDIGTFKYILRYAKFGDFFLIRGSLDSKRKWSCVSAQRLLLIKSNLMLTFFMLCLSIYLPICRNIKKSE